LRRPQISYRISDYTRKGIVQSRKMVNLIFAKMGAKQFTKVLPDDPSRFDADVDGEKVILNFMGAGHLMGTTGWAATPRTRWSIRSRRSWDHKNLFLVGQRLISHDRDRQSGR